LIITKGSEGVEIYFKNKKYTFTINNIKSSDAIGAGDTFFANFIVSFINTDGMIEKSCSIAMNKVEKFLLNKKYE
jgi:fructose-1-phosphate kinase PfkB-like protein